MEEEFRFIASNIALVLEASVVLVVAFGAGLALFRMAAQVVSGINDGAAKRQLWLRFASWILMALEFALAADIVRTAIAPTWDEIGKLGAIAGIRIVLGFFLGKDLETMEAGAEKRTTAT